MVRACSTSFVNTINFSLLAVFCSPVSRGRILLIFGEVVTAMGERCEVSEHEEALLFPTNKKNTGYIPISN